MARRSQGDSPMASKLYTIETLGSAIFDMNRGGGYILAFSARIGRELPELTWPVYRAALLANGTFCGYAESSIRQAFEKGAAQ